MMFTLDETIAYLNRLNELDPEAMANVFNARYHCNDALVDAPRVQCGNDQGKATVGPLGIINGIFDPIQDEGHFKGWGQITAAYGEGGRIECFRRTTDGVRGPPSSSSAEVEVEAALRGCDTED